MKKYSSLIISIFISSFFLAGAFIAPVQAQKQEAVSGCEAANDIFVKEGALDHIAIQKGVKIEAGQRTLIEAAGLLPPANLILNDSIEDPATIIKWALVCSLNMVYVITNWVFIILLALAIGLIALGGFFWITSGAEPGQQKRATAMIGAAVIGFLIAILAKFIPALVTGLLF